MDGSRQKPEEALQLDESEPSPERQAALLDAIEENLANGKPPFEGVAIRHTSELDWVSALLPRQPSKNGDLLAERTDLRGADFRYAQLPDASFFAKDLTGAVFGEPEASIYVGGPFGEEHPSPPSEAADLSRANLQHAILCQVNLRGVSLYGAVLNGADLSGASLERANLQGAILREVRMDNRTQLTDVALDDETCLADVEWNGARLTRVNWADLRRIGDETRAQRGDLRDFYPVKVPSPSERRSLRAGQFDDARRAYSQLAVALREQGLKEPADRFAYRAQVCQRHTLRLQRQYLRALGSWLLDVAAGYGYKPMRSFIAYVFIICLFAGAYLLNAQFAAPHLTWDEALVLSISSFHGRGFFTSGISLGDTLARLAAGEAIIGLLIEITFIATFTQRFFAR